MPDSPGFGHERRNQGSTATGQAPKRPLFHAKAAAIATLGVPVIEGIGATYSWIETGTEHLDTIRRSGRPAIYALWHGRIMPGIIYLRDRDIVVMTSENFDGEWIARVIRRFGYTPARGSTSRGGSRALVEMRREMRTGKPVAFTLDGPRGPREVAQPGAVWLAGATGNPILPFHIEASSYWTAKSWDRHQIPKPGSVVVAAMGAPIEIPRKVDDAMIGRACRQIEDTLKTLQRQAIALTGREG